MLCKSTFAWGERQVHPKCLVSEETREGLVEFTLRKKAYFKKSWDLKPEPEVLFPASPTPKTDKNFLCSRVCCGINNPLCGAELLAYSAQWHTVFFNFILFFTTQGGRMVLRLLSLVRRSRAQVQKLRLFSPRLFYWSKTTLQVRPTWTSLDLNPVLFDWLIHSFIYSRKLAFIYYVFLPHLLYAVPSARAVVTAVNKAGRDLPWWIS